MNRQRGASVVGSRALALVLGAPIVVCGCAESVTTQTVKSPVLERRTQADESEPLLRSEWQVEAGRIVGKVTWGSCVSERSWSVEEQRVEHVRPIPAAGYLTAGAGAAAIIGGLAAYKRQPVTTCTDVFPLHPDETAYQSCNTAQPENTGSKVAVLFGSVALVTGILLLAIKPSDKVTVLKHEPHVEKSVSPCVAAEDVAVMSLLLKLGANRFVHITVDKDGEASVDLPASARLPKGADLDVVVYRAPAALTKTLPRWTTIGHVHVPE